MASIKATTALLTLAVYYFISRDISSQEIESSCVENKHLEDSLSNSTSVSVLFYVENRCPCVAHRIRFDLSAGTWVRMPPEEIHPLECVLISSQAYAGKEQTTIGSVLYSCSETNTTNAMELKWDIPVANVTYFENGEPQPFTLVADDITATAAFITCGLPPPAPPAP